MKFQVALASIIALLNSVDIASAASFDCAKADTSIEKMICSDSQLSEMDDRLAEMYSLARSQSSDTDQVKTEQRDWIKSVRNSCTDFQCIRDAYAARISALALPENKAFPSSPETQAAPPSPDSDVKRVAMPESQTNNSPEPQSVKPVTNDTAHKSPVADATPSNATDAPPKKPIDWVSTLLAGLLFAGIWYWFKNRRSRNSVSGSGKSATLSEDEQRYQKMLSEQLFKAIQAKNHKGVDDLISKGVDIEAQVGETGIFYWMPKTDRYAAASEYGCTPLMAASLMGDDVAVKMLIKAGADVQAGHDIIGKIRTPSPLFHATTHPYPPKAKVINELIDAGADINGIYFWGVVDPADKEHMKEMKDAVISQSVTPLFNAAQKLNTEAVIALINRGADIHAKMADGKRSVSNQVDKFPKEVSHVLIAYITNGCLPTAKEMSYGEVESSESLDEVECKYCSQKNLATANKCTQCGAQFD